MSLFNFLDKTVIITGGGSGIGKSIATLFAQQGACVFILDISESQGLEVATEIRKRGGKASVLVCDIAQKESVYAVFEQVIKESGRIDILINNAGIAHIGNAENTSESDFDRLFQVNVKGVYYCMQAVLPQMKRQGGGVILNMSSVSAKVGLTDRFAYSMSKGAVASMTLSVAKDYLPFNIRCNSISPARIHTPFVDGFISKNYAGKESEIFEKLSKSQPMGRMGKPEEVAALALYLCTDEAGFITGTDYPIDGGFLNLNT
jgi:NAD(P)-dependent dehydrogenase (short-subunit alcohol dehydrogenase family)